MELSSIVALSCIWGITSLFYCNTDFFKFYNIFLLSSSYVSCWNMNGNSTASLTLCELTLSVVNRLTFENNYLSPSYWLKSVTLAVDGSHSWLIQSFLVAGHRREFHITKCSSVPNTAECHSKTQAKGVASSMNIEVYSTSNFSKSQFRYHRYFWLLLTISFIKEVQL